MLPPPLQSSLPAGRLAFTGRELNPLDRYKRFQITFSFSFSGFILTQEGPFLHLSYSCASPFGPALLVTQDPRRTLPWQDRLYSRGHKTRIRSVIFPAQSAGWSKRQSSSTGCRPPFAIKSRSRVIEISWFFCF